MRLTTLHRPFFPPRPTALRPRLSVDPSLGRQLADRLAASHIIPLGGIVRDMLPSGYFRGPTDIKIKIRIRCTPQYNHITLFLDPFIRDSRHPYLAAPQRVEPNFIIGRCERPIEGNLARSIKDKMREALERDRPLMETINQWIASAHPTAEISVSFALSV